MSDLAPAAPRFPLGRFTLHWLIAALIICAGIAGGIIVGMSFVDRGLAAVSEQARLNETNLDVGEVFPDYELYSTADSSLTLISELTDQGPVLLVFGSASCGACEAMDKFWAKRVFGKIDKRIQLVWVFNAAETAHGLEALQKFGVRTFYANRHDQMTEDGIVSTPSLVGLNANGRIAFIYTGFDRGVGAEEINSLI